MALIPALAHEFLAAASAGRSARAADDSASKVRRSRPRVPSVGRHRLRKAKITFLNIDIQGYKLGVVNDLRATRIEATKDAVAVELFKEASKVHVAKPEQTKSEKEESEILGKAFHQFKHQAFRVTYQDADWKSCQTRKGLSVPTKKPTGEALGKEKFEAEVGKVK